MQALPKIPIPPAERWRHFRLSTLPVVAFIITLLGIALLWKEAVNPATLPGQVEEIKSKVISPLAGTITELRVARFQVVTKGTVLAVIKPIDNRATLDFLRSQLENLQGRLDPQVMERGAELKVQRLLLPLMEQKVSLATAQSNLGFAESEFQRADSLFKQNAMTAQAYDVVVKKKQAIETGITEQKKLIADLSEQLEKLHPPQLDRTGPNSIENLLHEQERKLREIEATTGPIAIEAPIDGMISQLDHHAGEGVIVGETLAIIDSLSPERIIGYLREPFPIEPKVGMEVTVRSRAIPHQASTGLITNIGMAFEPITNPLLHPSTSYEIGLPIQVSLPRNLKVRPGSVVDLTLLRKN